ncbi:acyl-CoA thioesterase domain-containing protein [Nocardia sp. NPDC051833]|uniref:acyl-CoA thioesterase n=1 Tax=Nocardia sp. NPDC051833 TaxID=3155674 RepID=UPI003427B54D
MTDVLHDLMTCLDLREPDPRAGHTAPSPPGAASRMLTGANQQLPHRRLFGGQLLAQFVRAAHVHAPDRSIKSLHALFTREGRTEDPVTYLIDPVHLGRSFGALTVSAWQGDRTIATCAISLHSDEDGPAYQPDHPALSAPGPEHRVEIELLPWDTRATSTPDDGDAGADFDLWMRLPGNDSGVRAALLAYASDLHVIATALRSFPGIDHHGNGRDFTSATTSHTLWFHHPMPTDGWLLLRHRPALVGRGRCYGQGDVFGEDGTLIASFAQESLLRFPAGTAPRPHP